MANDKTTLETVWSGGLKGSGRIKANYLNTNIAMPTSGGGSGEGTDPKELLISSATACYTMTLTSMLDGRKLPVEKVTIDTESTSSEEEGMDILHVTHVTLSADATDNNVQAVHKTIEIANERCEVGNMLRKAGVTIKAEGKTYKE